MKTVTWGATRLEATPIAYGTWQFGGDWGPVDERAAVGAISHARSMGINVFDTAQVYGFGRSERLLGRAPMSTPSVGGPRRVPSAVSYADKRYLRSSLSHRKQRPSVRVLPDRR
jgi:aryl-alcohol dehydrogenase-like predicted oxidoreductase